MSSWKAQECMCAASRRVQSLPQGGWVRKETHGSTTDLAAKANRDSSMSSKRSSPEDVYGLALQDPCATVKATLPELQAPGMEPVIRRLPRLTRRHRNKAV